MTTFNELIQQNCFSTDQEAKDRAAIELEHQYGCEVNCIEIDPSVQFAHHGRGSIIIAAKICSGVVIFQNVTIGSNQKFNRLTNQWENLGNPVLGQNVIVADGAKILGPVIIGANSVIGAGAIITKDVPSDSIAYGVNKIKARDPHFDLVFHNPMPQRDQLIQASQEVIERYNHHLDN